MRKFLYLLLFLFIAKNGIAQKPYGIFLKTNLLNLIAKRPSFSIEKTIALKYGLELSYNTGVLNWGRDYEYNGFLLRAKMYAYEIKQHEITPFFGIYTGNLNKTIVSNNAYVHPTGYLSFGNDRNFKANSIRSGINIGFLYIPAKRFFLETTTGIGYGKYFNIETFQLSDAPKGYLDFQLALSVGYSL